MKNKNVAGILALFFGIFGTHRFYLGQRFLGAVYFLLFWGGLGITIEEGFPLFMLLPVFISIVDSIVFFAMPWSDFDRRYNKAYFRQQEERQLEERSFSIPVQETQRPLPRFEHHKKEGIRKFRAHDYPAAVADFLEALRIREDDPAICFNLACCYSMLGQSGPGFYYLQQALANGFEDLDIIKTHKALDYLRKQPQFEEYLPRKAAPPVEEVKTVNAAEEFLDLNLHDNVEIPEPLLKLEDLKNRGILTEEEFEEQKQKMFGYR